MSKIHSVCIIDDHDIVRKGLRNVFSLDYGFNIIGEADSCMEAEKLFETVNPDAIIMDQMLGDGSGIELARKIKPNLPDSKIILLTAFPITDDSALVKESESICAVLYKDQSSSEIRKDVMKILGYEMKSDSGKSQTSLKLLSEREQEILQFISRGWQNKEISSEIGISEKTVRNTISNIFKKLNVNNRTEAARIVLE